MGYSSRVIAALLGFAPCDSATGTQRMAERLADLAPAPIDRLIGCRAVSGGDATALLDIPGARPRVGSSRCGRCEADLRGRVVSDDLDRRLFHLERARRTRPPIRWRRRDDSSEVERERAVFVE